MITRTGEARRIAPFPPISPRSEGLLWVAQTLHKYEAFGSNAALSHFAFAEFVAPPQGGQYLTPIHRAARELDAEYKRPPRVWTDALYQLAHKRCQASLGSHLEMFGNHV